MNDKIKASQISITLENDLLATINETAKKSAMSRSKFIERCIRSYLNPPPGPDITGLQQTIEQQKQLLADKETDLQQKIEQQEQLAAEKEERIQQIKADEDARLKQAIDYHKQLLNDKDAIIKDKDVVITEITNQNNWLRGEYAKLNDRLNALLLPAPKKSIWDKILRRNKILS